MEQVKQRQPSPRATDERACLKVRFQDLILLVRSAFRIVDTWAGLKIGKNGIDELWRNIRGCHRCARGEETLFPSHLGAFCVRGEKELGERLATSLDLATVAHGDPARVQYKPVSLVSSRVDASLPTFLPTMRPMHRAYRPRWRERRRSNSPRPTVERDGDHKTVT